MSDENRSGRSIFVWDLPTRLFHWLVVALVAVTWASGEAEGPLFVVHKLAGYGVVVAILFRLIWGLVGSYHSRFRDFIHPWPVVRDYARGLLALRPKPALGHNPLGGWMVVLLLTALLGMVATGLFASEDGVGGPLAELISPAVADALSEVHEGLFNVLLVLVGIHVAGVLVDSVLTGHNLVRSMVTGRKQVTVAELDAATTSRRPAPYWIAAVALGAATGVTWLLVAS
ncbi:MAG: cytochrome b/b6 domain-containing protein [Gammaproteobacteria bacterium]|nr:MAG: cytochrome b/b6 domain-containing protein [Gammaproteobacteria bacterium]